MKSIVGYLLEQLKGLIGARQESAAPRAVSTIRYSSGAHCLMRGRIETAVSGSGNPLVVPVSQLDLLGDLQTAGREAEVVAVGGPDYTDSPDMVRALAYATGAPVKLGRFSKAPYRTLGGVGGGSRSGHAA